MKILRISLLYIIFENYQKEKNMKKKNGRFIHMISIKCIIFIVSCLTQNIAQVT